MRKKIALLSLIAALAVSFAAAQTASASFISVTGQLVGATDLCRPVPEQLSYRLKFKAKISASGIKKPKEVRIGWQVVDSDNRNVLKSGVLKLKKSKGYRGETSRITATANQFLSYHVNLSYYVNGRKKKAKATFADQVPTVEQMDAAGIPACA